MKMTLKNSNEKPNKSNDLILEPEDREASLSEKAKGIYYNIAYKFQGFFANKSSQENLQYDKYILGKKCLHLKDALQLHTNIIWFTYRENVIITQHLRADTGWGCLVRVAQMMMATAIQKFFEEKKMLSQNTRQTIITAFLDDEGIQEKYSLRKIVIFAQKHLNLKAGEWFNITQVCHSLKYLHIENPLKGTEDLKIQYFPDSIVFLDQLYEAFQLPICFCQKKRFKCQKCHPITNEFQEQTSGFSKNSQKKKIFQCISENYGFKNEGSKHLINIVVVIVVRLAEKEISSSSYSKLLTLFESFLFIGMLGGKPKKALYLTGKQGEDIFYLDPHRTQESVHKKSLPSLLKTFECSQLRTVSRKDLDPSFGMCFYLRNLDDLEALTEVISKTKPNNETPFCSWQWENKYKSKKGLMHEEEDIESIISQGDYSVFSD